MAAKRQRLVFLYRWSRRNMGGSQMRVQQLAAHMRRFHGDTYDVRVLPMAAGWKPWSRLWVAAEPAGGVYVFSKNLIAGWRPEDYERLRAKAAAVLIDYVDLKLSHAPVTSVDCHISTSYAGADAIRARLEAEGGEGEVATVLHNYDVALDSVPVDPPEDELAMAYLGTPTAAPWTPLIERNTTVLDGSNPTTFNRDVQRIGAFNTHYCVRKRMPDDPLRSFRPFTKGVTAAALGAVVITDRNADDAERLLGSDYPFLLPDNAPETIDDGFRRMRDSFGGPLWRRAQDRIERLRQRTSHEAIARSLHGTIRSVIH
ncbi:hypothetical protein HKCCE2091_11990 [Rhodobacterales bacterium HKCCE2091]|nr:hypothetical protein [Rhodobacterales bacterium HKCCE2091]